MTTSFFGHAQVEAFTGAVSFVEIDVDANGNPIVDPGNSLPTQIFNDVVFFISFGQVRDAINDLGPGSVAFLALFDDTAVDYSLSLSPVFIDLLVPTQHGGFAEGDQLVHIFEVTGSPLSDVIRGSNSVGLLTGTIATFHDPGDNILHGGNGNDVLEGRGGADVLDGGSGFDIASYESSPEAVNLRLPGVGADTQTGVATGGDASGDTLVSIEGLVGSRFADTLTGNALNNVLAGGLGDDALDGRDGIDTADYSRDHFFDNVGAHDTADEVVAQLGLGGGLGIGTKFKAVVVIPSSPVLFVQESIDTLKDIENVTGTAGADNITGNELDNVLNGRDGDDTLDGGFGNDTLVGGPGEDTASFVSHDTGTLFRGEHDVITLGPGNSAGSFIGTAVLVRGAPEQTVEADTLLGIEDVVGSNRSETINGNELNNVLDGRGGNDTSMVAPATTPRHMPPRSAR